MPILGGGSTVRAGTVQAWPSNTIPSGWLKCNGAAVSRTLYAALFTEIGTTYGAGDGSTTFNVPDMRGEFMRGADDGRGVDSGRNIGTAQSDETRSHQHGFFDTKTTANGDRSQPWPVLSTQSVAANPVTNGVTFTGGSETRPRNRCMHFIIKF
jgi:microcystin-dependent protein